MRRSWLSVVVGAVLVAVIVGAVSAFVASRPSQSMEWVIQDLGTLGGRESVPSDLNGHGQIVGSSDTRTSTHAFLWENGEMIDLGAFGGTFSNARAINERGEIVGLRVPDPAVEGMEGYPYNSLPVLWRNGQVTVLPELTVSGCDGNVDWDSLLGIDDRSRVVGTINITTAYSGCQRAAVWLGRRWTVLRDLSLAVAFNQRGQIVGSDEDGHAALWTNGETKDIGTLGGKGAEAHAINERGQIVGWSETASGASHAFLWQAGKLTDLGTLGGTQSSAATLNERGQIVGSSQTASGAFHAFLWQDGNLTDLGTLGGTQTLAAAINERGQIVGSSQTASGMFHAFFWQDGKMTDLGTLGGKKSSATEINDEGQIVGWATTKTGQRHAVLWTLGNR
jgi:probable HAF family extracellular repeat protein